MARPPGMASVVGRLLVCTKCGAAVDVLEAAVGASTDDEHRWIDPAAFVCGGCLDGLPLPDLVETSTDVAEVAGRARTAQERAAWLEKGRDELQLEGRA